MVRLVALLSVLLPALVCASQNWDGLRVTWDLNPLDTWAFNALPRDLNKDDRKGFEFKDDQCAVSGGAFRGQRYWYNNKGTMDPAVIILFDVNGYVAGFQTSMPKSQYTPSAQNIGHPYISDGDNWTLTIYTVDPSKICTTGRTADEYATQGTGYGLWFQNGSNPETDSIRQPDTETAAAATKWSKGYCFLTLGVHYWYNLREDMSCDEMFPFFLLYNKGKLNAGGFAMNANLASKRYEHPPLSVSGQFMNPVPKCIMTDPSFKHQSTMHVYMTDSPRTGCLC